MVTKKTKTLASLVAALGLTFLLNVNQPAFAQSTEGQEEPQEEKSYSVTNPTYVKHSGFTLETVKMTEDVIGVKIDYIEGMELSKKMYSTMQCQIAITGIKKGDYTELQNIIVYQAPEFIMGVLYKADDLDLKTQILAKALLSKEDSFQKGDPELDRIVYDLMESLSEEPVNI